MLVEDSRRPLASGFVFAIAGARGAFMSSVVASATASASTSAAAYWRAPRFPDG